MNNSSSVEKGICSTLPFVNLKLNTYFVLASGCCVATFCTCGCATVWATGLTTVSWVFACPTVPCPCSALTGTWTNSGTASALGAGVSTFCAGSSVAIEVFTGVSSTVLSAVSSIVSATGVVSV